MRKTLLSLFAVVSLQLLAFPQNGIEKVPNPTINDFAGPFEFLASEWMEGRGVGQRGGFMAADYVASMMHLAGLTPVCNSNLLTSKAESIKSYSHDFEIVRHWVNAAGLSFTQGGKKPNSQLSLIHGVDFVVNQAVNDISINAPLIFVGYGIFQDIISDSILGDIDVKGRVVVMLDGFPGCKDTSSLAWQSFGKKLSGVDDLLERKVHSAFKKSAKAVIIIRSQILQNKIVSEKNFYIKHNYALPLDIPETSFPVILLSHIAENQITSLVSVDLAEFEKQAAQLNQPSLNQKDIFVNLSVDVEKETVKSQNIIGMVEGKDKTRSVILGAHYDHLGKHNDVTYYGADDNASGTAGLLALAKVWVQSSIIPPCNLIFASWGAEEKGLLGSRYFAQSQQVNPDQVLLYINMDMISGSALDDTARNMLSIGIREVDADLRTMAAAINEKRPKPFVLDLWDVMGYTGSDYASFTEKNIPVMTFNSGLHDYYHTPNDTFSRSDLTKMETIIELVNDILLDFFEQGID